MGVDRSLGKLHIQILQGVVVTGGGMTSAAATVAVATAAWAPRFVDIGANLLDPMFQGVYNGSSKHPGDLDQVLARARAKGVQVGAGQWPPPRQAATAPSPPPSTNAPTDPGTRGPWCLTSARLHSTAWLTGVWVQWRQPRRPFPRGVDVNPLHRR